MDDLAEALLILLVTIGFVWLVPLMRKKILSIFKGWIGEKKTIFYLWLSLRKNCIIDFITLSYRRKMVQLK